MNIEERIIRENLKKDKALIESKLDNFKLQRILATVTVVGILAFLIFA